MKQEIIRKLMPTKCTVFDTQTIIGALRTLKEAQQRIGKYRWIFLGDVVTAVDTVAVDIDGP
jgi:hypothetical protein